MKNTAALNQGIKFKTYQKKITKKGVLIEGFSSNQNDILLKQSDELKHGDELKLLQEDYNNALEKYNESNKKLLDESANYVKNINHLNTNVFVNHLVNNPTAKYINSFNDDASNKSMILSSNAYVDLNKCKMNASNGGYSYFGLQDMQPDGTSQCFLGNDYNVISKYGEYIQACSKGIDGHMYGGPDVNAIYSLNMEYIGCYSDKGSKLMMPSGPDTLKSSLVYVSGDFGISPWGSSNFPDKTAKWIWYTQNSQIDAPTNSGVPITLFYMYNYTGNTYINAFLCGMCDDNSSIYLNSVKIGDITGGWGGNGSKLPIQISPGMNYIEASVENSGGPAGFLLTVLDSENNVLFNTNSNWKYTTILPSEMKVNAQNFSFDSCNKYAKDNNYQYFGLQNGSTGTSQCFVSNDLKKATQNGLIEGTASLNGNVYGLKDVNSVYEITPKGDNSAVGKFGYIDEKTILSEYPLSMIDLKKDKTYQNILNYDSLGNDLGVINNTTQSNCKSACDENLNCYGYTFDTRNNVNNCYPKNANIYPKSEKKYTPGVNLYYSNPIIKNNDSCEKSIQNIDSIQWDNYKKSGKMMTPETLCGLAKMNESSRNETNMLREQLGTIANKIVEKLLYLESLNVSMIQQMGLDKTELDNLLKKYTAISLQYNHYQEDQRNINGIVEDSKIVVLQENYQYIFWSILTMAVLVITIRILNK